MVNVGETWETASIPLAATPLGADIVVELRSTTFIPGPKELADRQDVSEQLRFLGVQIDWVELVPSSGTTAACTAETPSTRRDLGLED